jgi:hypothetical protein
MMTDDLLKDAVALTRYDRALLWARLGEAWWQDDRERAQTWMQKAVEEMETAADQGSAAERGPRLAAARSLLSIITLRDGKLSTRLMNVFTSGIEQAAESDREANAQALASAALAVLDIDPKRAAELGSMSIRLGRSTNLVRLLWRLRERDTKLADALFRDALKSARITYDYSLLIWLDSVAFKAPAPSDELRRELLSVITEGLMRQTASAGDEAAACQLSSIIAPRLDELQRLLPQQAGMARLAIARCQPTLNPTSRQPVDESLSEEPLKTIDDFLKAAGQTSDRQTRDQYLSRAVNLAAEQKNFDRAVAILDGMTREEQEQMGETWSSWRWTFASLAAVNHLQREDRYKMWQVINTTPARLRPLAQISVAKALFKKGDRGGAIELMDEARKGMTRLDLSEATSAYVSLVTLYVELMPSEAPTVFRDAVASMNRAGSSETSGSGSSVDELDKQLLSHELVFNSFANLPARLLETNELVVGQTISLIESPLKREVVRLKLLRAALEQRSPVTPPSTKKTAMSKGQPDAHQ